MNLVYKNVLCITDTAIEYVYSQTTAATTIKIKI